MSMYDDLDPEFISSPGAALPIVAARVRAIRKRRLIAVSGLCGAIAVVLLASMAFGSSGNGAHRVTVANEVTTTTDDSPSTTATLSTDSTTTPSSTTLPTSTTATLPIPPATTPAPTDTTAAPQPAHLTVSFDRDRLVIQSGTSETISYTVTNDGDEPGGFGSLSPDCLPDQSVWPDDVSKSEPLLWPLPAEPRVFCIPLMLTTVPPHDSRTFPVTVVAGLHDNSPNDLVPAPPGQTTFLVQNGEGPGEARLPVTITPPATPPLTVSHPMAVTTASGAQHWVNFTITNNLPFPVRYTDQGPCSSDNNPWCRPTTPDGVITMDMRRPPYASAEKPLYLTQYVLGANEVRTVRAAVHGTTSLEDIDLGSPDMPPGVYYFDWDGDKVTFTVTPPTP